VDFESHMPVKKGESRHGKYGRDQCITCFRRLGLGLDVVSKLTGLHRRTLAALFQERIREPRYTGFDEFFRKYRHVKGAAKRRSRIINAAEMTFREKALLHREWMSGIREDARYWGAYDTVYRRKFRHWEPKNREKKKQERKAFREKFPDAYASNREKERIAMYLRRGVPEDQIPAKMSRALSEEDKRDLRRIRRKKDYLRGLVTDVWKSRVSDVTAFNQIGCTSEDFHIHIISQFQKGWKAADYGTVWNFDHIKPLHLFNVLDPLEARKANHWTNLRPCCVMENSLKSGRWEGD